MEVIHYVKYGVTEPLCTPPRSCVIHRSNVPDENRAGMLALRLPQPGNAAPLYHHKCSGRDNPCRDQPGNGNRRRRRNRRAGLEDSVDVLRTVSRGVMGRLGKCLRAPLFLVSLQSPAASQCHTRSKRWNDRRSYRGRPRPRVAMMFRMISDVPAAIVSGTEFRYSSGSRPCSGACSCSPESPPARPNMLIIPASR